MSSRLFGFGFRLCLWLGPLTIASHSLLAQHFQGHAGDGHDGHQQSQRGLTAGQRLDAAGYGRGHEYSQTEPGHFGHGHTGMGQAGFGNFRATGSAIYGQPGLVQQFGGNYYSAGTYSSNAFGRSSFGVSRGSAGVIHYAPGFAVPTWAATTGYGYSPFAYADGSGTFPQGWGSPAFYDHSQFGWVNNSWQGFGVPYVPWCQSAFPYYGGIQPYFAGSILAPTIISLNISMRPIVPSTAAYTLTDPRILDLVAPAPNAFPLVPPVPVDAVPDAPPLAIAAEGLPILNEFDAVPRSEKISTLAEKIHSLRYQSTGDDAFRREDYVTAEVFYKSAIEIAPDRRAPYLRMAFVQIALADFANAVGRLKTGLMMPGDATRAWVTAEELYGQRVAERARSHGGKLWNWLAGQPLSSDRLLLAGTFQTLRGFDGTASELLELSSHEGPEAAYVSALLEIARTDIGQRAVDEDRARILQESEAADRFRPAAAVGLKDTRSLPADVNARPAADGIFMRGKAVQPIPRAPEVVPPVPLPDSLPPVEPPPAPVAGTPAAVEPPPLQIPIP